jgi:glycogen synthase
MVFYDRDIWQKLQHNGMMIDFSWDRAARQYIEAYQRITSGYIGNQQPLI